MDESDPDYLYHYTTSAVAFECILPERRLRLSPFVDMGDPLEAKEWLFSASYAPGSFDDDEWNAAFWRSLRLVNEFKQQTKLLAMTVDAEEGYEGAELRQRFGKGWARARMWERYAERHRGVCLAFHAERLVERVVETLSAQGATRVLHGPVNYSDGGLSDEPGATMLDLRTPEPEGFEVVLRDHFDNHGRQLFFTKTSEWATEYEYRLAGFTPDSTGFTFVDFGDALSKVYVGDRFPAVGIPGVAAICEALDVEPRQMRWETFYPWDFRLTPLGEIDDLRRNLKIHRERAAEAGPGPVPPFKSMPGRPG